jgi:hypothetical protein
MFLSADLLCMVGPIYAVTHTESTQTLAHQRVKNERITRRNN